MSELDEIANEIDFEEEPFDSDREAVSGPDGAIEEQFARQPFRVVYQTNNFLLPQILSLIDKGEGVNLRPEYQRRLRWSNQQKSLLIESLLLNVPIPPVFFYENDLARYEVMDGQQRLNAIKEFLNNEFSLIGLQILSSLNGRNHSRLTPRVRRSLDRATISAVVVLQESQGKLKKAGSSRFYELRRFVFERLNTGGKRLSAQEIRNAIYGGRFNDLIVSLSRDPIFTTIWSIPPYEKPDPNDYFEERERQRNSLYKTMGDCQLVLRFFALIDESNIHGPMKSILDKCMERYLDCSSDEALSLERRYKDRLALAFEMFDGRPFYLSSSGADAGRPVAGIYDGVMVALDGLWDMREKLIRNKKLIQSAYAELVLREADTGALTGSANTSVDIKNRIKIFRDLFKQFI